MMVFELVVAAVTALSISSTVISFATVAVDTDVPLFCTVHIGVTGEFERGTLCVPVMKQHIHNIAVITQT